MATRVPPDLLMMLLADARLPVAGHTQSNGLEPALADGMPPEEVPGYCRTRLNTVALVDAAASVVARRVTLDAGALAPVERAWAARTPSPAMRATSRTMARGLLRLAHRVWPDEPAMLCVATVLGPSRPLVLGSIAAATGLGARELAVLVGYDDVQTVVSAALKLAPLDPTEATTWVWNLLPDIEFLADRVADLTLPEEIPAPCAPQIEAWAQAHASATRRLFSA